MNINNFMLWIRQFGWMHQLDTLKFGLVKAKNAEKNKIFLKKYPDIELPPDYILFESFKMDYEKYFIGGKESAAWLKKQIQPYLMGESLKILDWGCGPARLLRHLPALFENKAQFFGVDYNDNTIKWCQKSIKDVTFFKNDLNPPLTFEPDFFDVIYGISVFTHLSQQNHFLWFSELNRVLKQGGILLFTTHGIAFRAILTDKEKIIFDNNELVVRANVIEGHRVFSTFHPPAFMKPFFELHCEILVHEPGKVESWGINQDVWILRKK
jgi:SAM-dependent methyltransferase